MVTYLIKSTLCLTLFLAFYHLVLEREKMHRFNRYYLLSTVIISFLAPLYTIYIKTIKEPVTGFIQNTENIEFPEDFTPIETPINYWNYALYFSIFISVILLLRFFKNLYSIYKKVAVSEKFKHKNSTIVLVNDNILPHTFWNYIFINKNEYETKKIEEELFTHELTHVTQKHTIDIILVELLKIVFWFNPLFYVLKKSIQLNHEFLADSKVITQHKNIQKYQHLLINTSAWKNDYALASNLHYLVTKKRLVMMTKQTSKTIINLKKLAVLPLIIGVVFLFAERVEAQESVETIIEEVPFKEFKENDNTLYKEYVYKNSFITVRDNNGNTVKKKFSELTAEEKKNLPPAPPLISKKKTPSTELIEKLKNNTKYALWIDGKVVKNQILNNYKATNFASYFVSFVHKNARSKKFPQEYQANLSTKKYFDAQNKKRHQSFLKWVKEKYNVEEITTTKTQNSKHIDVPIKTKSSKQSINSETVLEDIKLKLKDSNGLELSIINENYKKLNAKYEKLRTQKPHFIESSAERQKELKDLFSKLGSMYFKLSKADKKNVKRPIHPHHPYVKLIKSNKVFYKLKNNMTEEDKLLLPPPPLPHNAITKQKAKAEKANRATQKDIKEYNKLSKKYNNKPLKKRIIKVKDYNKIKQLYDLLSDKQKQNAEPFPNFPPPLTSKPTSIKVVKKGEKYNIPPPPPPMKKRKGKKDWVVGNEVQITKEESFKNTTFYLNGKIIAHENLNEIDPKDIKTTTVKKEKDGSGKIYITTKTNSNSLKVNKKRESLILNLKLNPKENQKTNGL